MTGLRVAKTGRTAPAFAGEAGSHAEPCGKPLQRLAMSYHGWKSPMFRLRELRLSRPIQALPPRFASALCFQPIWPRRCRQRWPPARAGPRSRPHTSRVTDCRARAHAFSSLPAVSDFGKAIWRISNAGAPESRNITGTNTSCNPWPILYAA